MYNMVPYISKLIHSGYGILNLSPIVHNINAYPRKDNSFGEDSSMILLYNGQSGDTIIAKNTYLSINNVQKSDSWSHPISSLAVQNTGSNQAK